ncbi:MAG: TetR/AcrR family transcriptional regulator [Gordonia sp. (in: high G+C Gram-positive bacteria)]|uniref:TetR/AcrR family transcriptional regulator n=1 Tax=Gordonia sp. (in: high G+C Gram-positive bacteria) TaxID=84139 RepID=UPI0039E28D4E
MFDPYYGMLHGILGRLSMGVKTDTRERMVAGAALVMREEGVAGTTVAAVLRRSGAPRGSVGFHFPGGRNELLGDALRLAGDSVSSLLRAAVDAGAPPDALIRGIGEYYKQQLVKSEFRAGCPVGAAALEAYDDVDLGPVVAEVLDDWTDLLAQALVKSGVERSAADDTALAAISAIEGAIMIARVKRSTDPIDLALGLVLPTLASHKN